MTTSRLATIAMCAMLALAACSSDVKSNATDATGAKTTPATAAATSPATSLTTAAATTIPTTVPATTVTTPAASTVATAVTTTAATTTTTTTTTTASAKTTTTTAKTTPKTSPKTSPAEPVFTSFSATVAPCPTTVAPGVSFTPPPDNGEITVKWSVTGPFENIYDALDNVNGPYSQNLPATGSASFSRICDGNKHTVFVVAVHNGTKVVKSKSYQQP